MEGRVIRRGVTLADQLAAVGPPPAVGPAAAVSCNLRDLLKLRDEDDLAAGRRAAVTLASAMAAERQVSLPSTSAAAAAAAARTLLDIIRDDQPTSGAGAGDPFVRRAVSLPAPSTASPPAPVSAPAEVAAPSPAPPPPPQPQPPAAAAEEEEQGERVSLMALLEQTDRQWSAGAPREEDLTAAEEALLLAEDDDDNAGPEPEAAAAGRGVVAGCCCVCMARAKGAAFIPCGHTFCRACARELLAGRGRCPLCNAAIVDVLDIF
ncbi:hypothetical protein BAE44_0004623 [Dichanthelium oligosanthes]|uniref:RING-type domain-containing protein n=1 Tax=Dichanthelium oligosanthes TaxID=888268 RepID=A0A1E5WAA5_9POAL|nr:hypothetical protein BAE44_0004623 [Dichanthelium oligosanthes]